MATHGPERAYGSVADPSTGGMRGGGCRLFDRTKNTLTYALAVIVRNVRIVGYFEAQRTDDAPSSVIGLGPGIRRRRHETAEPEPHDPPLAKLAVFPG